MLGEDHAKSPAEPGDACDLIIEVHPDLAGWMVSWGSCGHVAFREPSPACAFGTALAQRLAAAGRHVIVEVRSDGEAAPRTDLFLPPIETGASRVSRQRSTAPAPSPASAQPSRRVTPPEPGRGPAALHPLHAPECETRLGADPHFAPERRNHQTRGRLRDPREEA